jgi:hypothetical protein
MAGFFLFVVVVGAGLFALRAPTSFSSMSGAPSPRVQTFADAMPEASIAGQKADLEDVERMWGARGRQPAFSHLRDADLGRRTRSPYGQTAEEAAGRPVTILLPADRPDEEPLILEPNQASPRLQHPRIAIANICHAAHLSNNRRFDVDMTLYPLSRRMETAGDAAGI